MPKAARSLLASPRVTLVGAVLAVGLSVAGSSGCGDDTTGSGGAAAASGTLSGGTVSGGTQSSGTETPDAGSGAGPASSGSEGTGGDGGDASSSGTAGGDPGAGGGATWQELPARTSWQIQYIDYPVDRSFDVAMYDIDMVEISDDDIDALHDEGRIVICYFSAGTWEPYRPDADDFPEEVLGNNYDDPAFDDERYLDIRSQVVRDIMLNRVREAVDRGCDGVDPDNMNLDEVGEDITGFPLGAEEQLDYSMYISAVAHDLGISVGLKNSIEHAEELEPYFDFAVNEQCFEYEECEVYADSFIAADKAVFHIEYADEVDLDQICAGTTPLGISTILKSYDLDAPRLGCDD